MLIEIVGTGLLPANDPPRILVFPAISNGNPIAITVISSSATNIRAEFTADQSYQLEQVTLSYAAQSVSSSPLGSSCSPNDIVSQYSFMPKDQVKNKYGNGVQANFHVVQLAIVNKCAHAIVVPLAGITISPKNGPNKLTPYSLSHVTAEYSTDRKLTGGRAIFFNSVLALATMGSAIQPFFGPGFTQGVAILGGGFTQAAGTIMKDMSAEQLQNITSQSFGDSEQIGQNGGYINKFLFIAKQKNGDPFCQGKDSRHCPPVDDTQVIMNLIWIPTGAPTTAAATPSQPAAQ